MQDLYSTSNLNSFGKDISFFEMFNFHTFNVDNMCLNWF